MKAPTEYLWFETRKHRDYLNITPKIDAIVGKSHLKNLSEGEIL